jgi:hypothetical protein
MTDAVSDDDLIEGQKIAEALADDFPHEMNSHKGLLFAHCKLAVAALVRDLRADPLKGITYMVRYSPNCPMQYEVRTCGSSAVVDPLDARNTVTHGHSLEQARTNMVKELRDGQQAKVSHQPRGNGATGRSRSARMDRTSARR